MSPALGQSPRDASHDAHLERLRQRLEADLPVVIPTTTQPGLAVRPTEAALDALFALKQRPADQPVSLGVLDLAQAADWIDPPAWASDLIAAFPPASLTLLAPARAPVDPRLGGSCIAVRPIAHPATRALLTLTGPLTATSANITGRPPASDPLEAARDLSLPAEAALPGACPSAAPSTLVQLTPQEGSPAAWSATVIRQGMVPEAAVSAWMTRADA